MMSSKKLLVVLSATFLATSAQAGVMLTVEAENVWTTQQAGMTEVDFNDGTTSPYVSATGDYSIFDAPNSGTGQSGVPFGIEDGKFLSVPNPEQNGSATFGLGSNYDYFGMFWGSVDTYNTISFYEGESLVGSFSGGDIGPLIANGNQQSWQSNRFVNFFFSDGHSYDSVELTSDGFAFETDKPCFW